MNPVGSTSSDDSVERTMPPQKKRRLALRTSVQEQLECPICCEMMDPPILQCPNGHTICGTCKSKVDKCPSCRHEIVNIRCLALEKIAECLEVPCKYRNSGCKDFSPYHGRLAHELSCRFRPYNCPHACSECPVTGDIPQLLAHLQSDHEVEIREGHTFTTTYVISNPYSFENRTWELNVLNCHGYQFCLNFEAFRLGNSTVYMAFIRFMGHEEDAVKFLYVLEFGSDRGKLMWKGIPRSIRESHLKVRQSLEGLLIHRGMAMSLSGGSTHELRLKITGHISLNQTTVHGSE